MLVSRPVDVDRRCWRRRGERRAAATATSDGALLWAPSMLSRRQIGIVSTCFHCAISVHVVVGARRRFDSTLVRCAPRAGPERWSERDARNPRRPMEVDAHRVEETAMLAASLISGRCRLDIGGFTVGQTMWLYGGLDWQAMPRILGPGDCPWRCSVYCGSCGCAPTLGGCRRWAAPLPARPPRPSPAFRPPPPPPPPATCALTATARRSRLTPARRSCRRRRVSPTTTSRRPRRRLWCDAVSTTTTTGRRRRRRGLVRCTTCRRRSSAAPVRRWRANRCGRASVSTTSARPSTGLRPRAGTWPPSSLRYRAIDPVTSFIYFFNRPFPNRFTNGNDVLRRTSPTNKSIWKWCQYRYQSRLVTSKHSTMQ